MRRVTSSHVCALRPALSSSRRHATRRHERRCKKDKKKTKAFKAHSRATSHVFAYRPALSFPYILHQIRDRASHLSEACSAFNNHPCLSCPDGPEGGTWTDGMRCAGFGRRDAGIAEWCSVAAFMAGDDDVGYLAALAKLGDWRW
jgi:hypothetical protein